MEGVQDNRRSYRELNDDEGALRDDLAALDERLDKLTQQLDRFAHTSAEWPSAGASGIDERPSAPVADAPARLDHQLDQVTEESRAAAAEGERSDQSAALPPSQPSPPAPVTQAPASANWAEQIAARQRALDGGIPAPVAPLPAAAQPKSPAGPDLAGLHDMLRGLDRAEGAVGLTEAVQALSHKIDQIAASTPRAQDPIAFKQLEQAVVSLRGAISNLASDGALAQLAAEVRALAGQFERVAPDNNAGALARLDARIASLLESERAMPSRLDDSMRALSERLDRMQLSQGDQLALGAIEDRIAKLSEKLDASDARLQHFGAIEVGLADLLVYLEEMRDGGPRAAAPAEPEQPAPLASAEPPPASPLNMIPELLEPDAPAEAAVFAGAARRDLGSAACRHDPAIGARNGGSAAAGQNRTATASHPGATRTAQSRARADRSQSAARHAARAWQRHNAREARLAGRAHCRLRSRPGQCPTEDSGTRQQGGRDRRRAPCHQSGLSRYAGEDAGVVPQRCRQLVQVAIQKDLQGPRPAAAGRGARPGQ